MYSSALGRRAALSLVGAGLVTCFSSPAQAVSTSLPVELAPKSYAEWYSLLDFVPKNASFEELEAIFPELPGSGESRSYRNFVKRYGQGYDSREQVALYITKMLEPQRVSTIQVLPVLLAHLARTALQHAIRVGGYVYSTLRAIVRGAWYKGKTGAAALGQFFKDHPVIGTIVATFTTNRLEDLYHWFRENMP